MADDPNSAQKAKRITKISLKVFVTLIFTEFATSPDEEMNLATTEFAGP